MSRQEKKEKKKQETLELLKKFRPNIEIDEENSNENWTALKQQKEIAELRKENKKLMKNGILTQKERDKNGMDSMALQIENEELRKENKKLKEKLDKLRTDNIYEEGLYE